MANDTRYLLARCSAIAQGLGRPLDAPPRYLALTDTILLIRNGCRHEIAWHVIPTSRVGTHPKLDEFLREVIGGAPFKMPATADDYARVL